MDRETDAGGHVGRAVTSGSNGIHHGRRQEVLVRCDGNRENQCCHLEQKGSEVYGACSFQEVWVCWGKYIRERVWIKC